MAKNTYQKAHSVISGKTSGQKDFGGASTGKNLTAGLASHKAAKPSADSAMSKLASSRNTGAATARVNTAAASNRHDKMAATMKATAKPTAAPTAKPDSAASAHKATAAKMASAPKASTTANRGAVSKLASTAPSRGTPVRNDLSATTYPAKRRK